jgi:glycosyltransferase involved in cell wall biosynthesis
MSKEIFLTIAIPIFNGEKFLRQTLNEVMHQVEAVSEEIEVLISDNASTDGTMKIVEEISVEHPGIKVFKNERNLGADMNFDMAVERATGKFVWLLGDDDMPEPGAVSTILNIIKNGDYAVIFLNWSNWSEDLMVCNKAKAIDISSDVILKDHNEFLRLIKLNSIFVSANVVSREKWRSVECAQFIGTNWIQYAKVLRSCVGNRCYCISRPIVRYRASGQRYDKCSLATLENSLNLLRILDNAEEIGYGHATVDQSRNVVWANLPLELIRMRNKQIIIPSTVFDRITKPIVVGALIQLLLHLPSGFYLAGLGRPTYVVLEWLRDARLETT